MVAIAFGIQDTETLIVAQGIRPDAVQTGYLTDFIIIFHENLQNVLDLSIIPGFMILLQEIKQYVQREKKKIFMRLEGTSLKKDFMRFIVPSIAAQWVFTLYTMVDGIFVARGVSETALTAVNIAMPYTMALFSISILFAVGTSTVTAILLGEKNGQRKTVPHKCRTETNYRKLYIREKDFEYLFKSPHFPNKAISRQQAYNILADAGAAFGISSIGTHTLRKTFGYHMYQQTHDAVTIKEILNHSDISVTLRYIGINQDNKDKAIKGLSFRKRGHT